jgi:glycogen debranching enzyme
MFSGWGVRTLSEKEKAYNPVGYHLGTVWPHDNALIAAGVRSCGFPDAFRRIFTGILEAAMYFPQHRLPELFTGFPREDFGAPVRYPVACHPQAWSAAALPFLLTTALGLEPEAFEHRLRIVSPVLPGFIGSMDVRRLRVGSARVDLRFERSGEDISVRTTKVEGRLDVVVETGKSPVHGRKKEAAGRTG